METDFKNISRIYGARFSLSLFVICTVAVYWCVITAPKSTIGYPDLAVFFLLAAAGSAVASVMLFFKLPPLLATAPPMVPRYLLHSWGTNSAATVVLLSFGLLLYGAASDKDIAAVCGIQLGLVALPMYIFFKGHKSNWWHQLKLAIDQSTVSRSPAALAGQTHYGQARLATQDETAGAMRDGKRTPLDDIVFDDIEPSPRGLPSPIPLGRYYDEITGRPGRRNLYEREQHILTFGLNGMGKFTRLLCELLLTSENRSLVVLDVKGELAATTAAARRDMYGPDSVKIINPWGLHTNIYSDLESDGFEPLALLDPDSDEFIDDARALGEALIRIEGDAQPHWPNSARALIQGLIMWEKYRHGDDASLANVRAMLTEAETFEIDPVTDELRIDPETGREIPATGIRATAARIQKAAALDWRIAEARDLTNRFLAENTTDEIRSILSTADTQTQWLISRFLQRDMKKAKTKGVNFRQLAETPTTVYIIIPINRVSDSSEWLRLVITAALTEKMRSNPEALQGDDAEPYGLETLFILDEFYAAIGKLEIIRKVWSAVRSYGIKLMPILQSVGQLQELWDKNWQTMAGQAGAVLTIGPAGDGETAEWMSKRSGTTTTVQRSYNTGDSTGFSQSQRLGMNSGSNSGVSYQTIKKPLKLPEDFMSIPIGMGYVWTITQGDTPHPIFAPNYWKVKGLGKVRKNPAFRGSVSRTSASAAVLADAGA